MASRTLRQPTHVRGARCHNGIRSPARLPANGAGHARSRELELTGDPLRRAQQTLPRAAPGADGTLVAVWHDYNPEPNILPTTCHFESTINARAVGAGCVETAGRLCLKGGRFGVEVAVDDPVSARRCRARRPARR